jgi:chromosome segregation protein
MKLERLEIQGFKSFKDRTIIHFDEGITGIVGPNGCGKSNVVDALFWVMGEQSAKHLRGTRMSDLIFSGSDKYNPGSFAEVTLVLHNTNNKHIHIFNKVLQPAEIQLSRKLYRNGEGEYRINGLPARLKDIQEVFLDTGAGAKSYSIIAQGEVDRLVKSKPEDRRTMIEEVAGITKFKLRKKESLRKIQATEQNLERIKDLKTEIQKALKNLEKQAEKANKARSLKEKINKLQFVIDSNKEFDHLDQLRRSSNLIKETEATTQELENSVSQLEIEIEMEKNQSDLEEKKLETIQNDFNEISKKLAAGEAIFESLEKEYKTQSELFEQREKEIIENKEELEQLTIKLAESQEKLNQLEENQLSDDELVELKNDVDQKKAELEEMKQEIAEKRALQVEEDRKLKDLENEEYRIKHRLDELSESFNEIHEEIEQIEEQSSLFTGELAEKRQTYKDCESSREEKEKTINKKIDAKDKVENNLKSKEQELETLSRDCFELETKIKNTKILIDSLEKTGENFQEFIDEHADTRSQFSKLIKVKKADDAVAIERVFTGLFNTVLEKHSLEDKEHTLESLFKSSENFCTTRFLSEESLEQEVAEGLTPVIDLIEVVDPSWSYVLSHVLKGYYLVDRVDQDLLLKVSDKPFKCLIDIEGSFLCSKNLNQLTIRSFVNDRDSVSDSVLKNKSDLDTFEKEFHEKQERKMLLDQEVTELKAKFLEVQDELKSEQDSIAELREQALVLKTQLVSHEEHVETGNARLAVLKNKKDSLSAQRVDLFENEDELADKIEDLKSKIQDSSAELADSEEDYKMEEARFEDFSTEYLEKKAVFENYFQNKESLQSLITDREKRIETLNSKIESYQEQVEELKLNIDSSKSGAESKQIENKELAKELLEIEKEVKQYKKDYHARLETVEKLKKKRASIDDKLRKNEKVIYENQLKVNKCIEDEELICRNFFEMFQVSLRSILVDYMEIGADLVAMLKPLDDDLEAEMDSEVPFSFEFERKIPSYLKDAKERFSRYKRDFNKLGEINWQAVKEYDKQKIRYDFLKDQEEELNHSIQDLLNAIEHIDVKSQRRFKEAFETVNDKFSKVFPIIFGGGSAKLQLSSNIEDPECGISIIAQPPGKKMQSINLMSGGEKALVAVSLIFSIFLVKPSPFCLLDEVDAPLDDANVGRFNELLREMSSESQFILITHNKKTMELNDVLYGITMQEAGVSKAVSIQIH